jgi:hypothetical protein
VGAIHEGLSAPTSLAAGADHVAALQPFSDQILVFTPDGALTRRVDIGGGTRGLARLSSSVYVFCDRERGQVTAIDLVDGTQWVFLSSLTDPSDLVVSDGECHVLDAGTRHVVTTDTHGQVTARLDLSPTLGAGAPISLGYDIARDAFHVFDQVNSRAHVLSRAGQYLGSYCSFGNEGGTVTRGGDLVCDADGYVYLVDRFQGRIAVFDPDWSFVLDIDANALPGETMVVPTGIAVDADGTIYVASTESDRIHIFVLDKTAIPQGDLAAAPLYPGPASTLRADDVELVARLAIVSDTGSNLQADFRIFAAGEPGVAVDEVSGVAAGEVGRDDSDRWVGTATWRPGGGLSPGSTYLWQTRARDATRVGDWTEPISFSIQAAGVRHNLEANYPNPFNPQTTIAFTVPAVGWATLEIFDLRGARVWSKEYRSLAAGRHMEVWEGRDNAGISVASGVYFYRLKTEGFEQTRKMALIR